MLHLLSNTSPSAGLFCPLKLAKHKLERNSFPNMALPLDQQLQFKKPADENAGFKICIDAPPSN